MSKTDRRPSRRDPDRRERAHVRQHSPTMRMEDCWRCGRALAVCRQKVQYGSREESYQAQDEIHAREGEPSVVPYSCAVCGWWHLTHATKPGAMKKARRRFRLLLGGASATGEQGSSDG